MAIEEFIDKPNETKSPNTNHFYEMPEPKEDEDAKAKRLYIQSIVDRRKTWEGMLQFRQRQGISVDEDKYYDAVLAECLVANLEWDPTIRITGCGESINLLKEVARIRCDTDMMEQCESLELLLDRATSYYKGPGDNSGDNAVYMETRRIFDEIRRIAYHPPAPICTNYKIPDFQMRHAMSSSAGKL